jgi:hypothetical protein
MKLTTLALALASLAGVAHAQQTVYAIGNGGASLLRFESDDPANVTVVGNFGGAGQFLDAIDFRPATGQLYGYLDSADAFFTVNLATAELTLASVGPSGAPTNTFQLGLDFNPTIDRARLVTDSDQNIVFNPVAGTAGAFTDLFYGPGDPNFDADPNIIENGYTNNVVGSGTTQQYAIDYGLDLLVTLANNSGVLGTVGPLGVDTDIYTGFDVFTAAGGVNTAYALLGDTPGFYSINLSTGAATLIGNLGFTSQVYSLAVVPIPAPAAGLMVGLGALAASRRRR